MHYWNKQNFEGLVQLAEALGEDPALAPLADYCRYRERGLRHKAFESLDSFLGTTETWETDNARNICRRVLELHALTPEAHQFLTQPLLSRFVFPVLETWIVEDPNNQSALRWLGILRGDPDFLMRALALSPDDVPVRRQLAYWFLSDVDFATHHLVESRLLRDLDTTKQILDQARAVVEEAPDRHLLEDVLAEIAEYDALLSDWESYSASPQGTFPEWCITRGRPYRWPIIVYYDK